MGQGRENARVFLKENKDIREKLETALRKKLGIASPNNSSATSSGPNGHATAPALPEKPPVKAAAAAASSSDAGKARPTR
jgi:recombination protein RecA